MSKPAFSVFHTALPWLAALMSFENPKVSPTGIFPITEAVPPSTGMSSMIPLLLVTSRVTPPMTSFGASILMFWIGSSMTGLDLTRLPLMAFLTAGMVWAGPRWMASSWSLASVSLTMTPISGSSASGPFLQTSLNPSMMSSLVSWRFWIPLVSLTRTLVPWMA